MKNSVESATLEPWTSSMFSVEGSLYIKTPLSLITEGTTRKFLVCQMLESAEPVSIHFLKLNSLLGCENIMWSIISAISLQANSHNLHRNLVLQLIHR